MEQLEGNNLQTTLGRCFNSPDVLQFLLLMLTVTQLMLNEGVCHVLKNLMEQVA